MTGKTKKAVAITGDVVRSTRLPIRRRKKLQERIEEFSQINLKQYSDLQIQQYRGDSIQATLTINKAKALSLALLLQSFLITDYFKIRIAIGFGEISFTGKDIITSDGTALRLSGMQVDELKKNNELIAVTAEDDAFNKEWQVHSASLNFLLQRLSPAQAEALHLQLQNMKQEDIAKKLKISQPSVHQRLQAAGANVITRIVERFELTASFL